MAARAEDRRIQRTQQLLRGALLSLIQEKGFEGLSVQDIIDRANVGRATFYAHFDNKEDLLASGIEGLKASLKERQRQALAVWRLDQDCANHVFVVIKGERDADRFRPLRLTAPEQVKHSHNLR